MSFHTIVIALFAQALSVALAMPAKGAELSFAPPFSNHMVLQRDEPMRIWGRAPAGVKVSVSVAGHDGAATAAADGRWLVTLPALSAGGPYEVSATASDGASISLADVLIGDVWLCSGQSNMQFAIKNATDGHEAVAAAAADQRLRLMTVPNIPSVVPTDQADLHWVSPTEDKATAEFSAVAIYFGLALHRNSAVEREVPIGLINCSLGGSWVEYWLPAEPAQPRGPVQPVSLWGVKPTFLYNGMIAPLAGLNLKGVLWYQGESNAGRPAQYAGLLRKMIKVWRDDFQDRNLPFFIVQLPPYADTIDGFSFAWLRDAQAQVATDPNAHLAVTLGTPDGELLHPLHKKLVGDRLALLARRYALGEPIVADGPTFKSARTDGAVVRVTFDLHGSSLAIPDNGLADFELAGSDGAFWTATAKVTGRDVILLHSDSVPAPIYVRYAFSASPAATVANVDDLPAGPFRTDTADPSPVMELEQGKPCRKFVTKRYSATIDSAGWLTGLMIGGRQFLSADLQGGVVPLSGFGPFPLPYCTKIGPARIAFDDNNLRFTYRFDADGVHIDVHNGNVAGEATVRCKLSSEVIINGDFAAGHAATFKAGPTSLLVEGADVCNKCNEGGYDLLMRVPAGQTLTLTLRTSG